MELPESIKEKYPNMVGYISEVLSKNDNDGVLLITTWLQEPLLEAALLMGRNPSKIFIVEESQVQFKRLREKYPQIPEQNCRKVEKVGGPELEKLLFDEWKFPKPTSENVVQVGKNS